jgi:uncharacterized protein YjbI with pentapeptide repeats
MKQTGEALVMRWLKKHLWSVGIASVSMLFLLTCLALIPLSAASAHEGTLEVATPTTVMVQATPSEDATVTALTKEQLAQQVAGQRHTWDNWLWSNAATTLSSFLSTLVVVIGVLFGFWQWRVGRNDTQKKESDDQRAAQDKELEDRKAERERRDEEQQRWLKNQEAEREKHAEERFQAAVTALGDDKEGARIGAAIFLRTFLVPGYERFYTQIFQLVTANLRLPRSSLPLKVSSSPLPLTALSQALIVAFMEAFPIAREQEKKNIGANFMPRTQTAYSDEYEVNLILPASVTIASKEIHALSAVGIVLDNGFLWYADLKQAWMAQASLQKTDFTRADLSKANLYEANLSEAYLWETNLSGANLWEANLSKADLRETNLSGAYLYQADLSGATLQQVNLQGADLRKANLSGANLSGTVLEDSLLLDGTDLRGVTGLTKKQLADSQTRGAII